jgi:hypothetical protein
MAITSYPWTRHGVSNGVHLSLKVIENPTEYGNFYVSATNQHGFVGYLYPDLSIRKHTAFYRKFNGYYFLHSNARDVIENFLNPIPKEQNMTKNRPLHTILDMGLSSLIQENAMFTAWDVTCRIRKDNPGVQVFHSVIKDYVHKRFEDGTLPLAYDRVLIPDYVPNPWCYYIPGQHDHKNYRLGTLPRPTEGNNKVVNATFGGITGGSH